MVVIVSAWVRDFEITLLVNLLVILLFDIVDQKAKVLLVLQFNTLPVVEELRIPADIFLGFFYQ